MRWSGTLVPWLAAISTAVLAIGLYLSLFVAPPDYQQGETVRIEETAPISRLKTWKVIDRVNTHATPERVDVDA